jgi:hypothetical protein
MAKGEQQEDGTRGGVGTITRTGDRRAPARPARAVPTPRPTVDPPWRVPPAERGPDARPEQAQPASRQPQAATVTRPRPRPQAQPRDQGLPTVGNPHRMPFVLLLCGLLGGALVSALVISTTLAEGSFEITKLQNSTSSLARQRQALEDQVAEAQSAPVIAAKAGKLGMLEVSDLRFFDIKTGKITTDIGVPQSYTPVYLP